jgi:hypothetical protein
MNLLVKTNKPCKHREKIEGKDMYVCTLFLDWWEEDSPKDRLFLTELDCMCEMYEEV